jgi:transposase
MNKKSGPDKAPALQVIKDIRRQTRRPYSAEEKIRIVLEGLRGEDSIAEICRREGIASSMYYAWSKEFLGEAESNRSSESIARRTASAAWLATPRAPPRPARSKTYAAKPRR